LVFPETGHWRAGHPKTCETQQAHSLVNLLALQLTETHSQFFLQRKWDSNANTFMQIEPTALNATGGWQTDSLARSADHKWAVFAADQFYLYSSDSDSLTSVPVFTVDPINNLYGVRGYAINANGTKIPVASAAQVTFLDHSSPISWFDLHSRRISAFRTALHGPAKRH
jgi:hypothetical protein